MISLKKKKKTRRHAPDLLREQGDVSEAFAQRRQTTRQMMSVSSMRCSSSPFGAVLQRAHPCQLRHPCLFSACGTAQRVRKLLARCKQLVVQSSAACYYIKQYSKKMLWPLVLDNRGSVGQRHTSFHCTATQEEGPCSTGRERAVGAWGRANGREPGAQLKTRAPANTSASRRQATLPALAQLCNNVLASGISFFSTVDSGLCCAGEARSASGGSCGPAGARGGLGAVCDAWQRPAGAG